MGISSVKSGARREEEGDTRNYTLVLLCSPKVLEVKQFKMIMDKIFERDLGA